MCKVFLCPLAELVFSPPCLGRLFTHDDDDDDDAYTNNVHELYTMTNMLVLMVLYTVLGVLSKCVK